MSKSVVTFIHMSALSAARYRLHYLLTYLLSTYILSYLLTYLPNKLDLAEETAQPRKTVGTCFSLIKVKPIIHVVSIVAYNARICN